MRKPIISERPDLFEPSVYIQFLVEISGDVSPDDLLAAVQTAYRVNEATMCRIVIEDDGRAFYEKLEESGCKASIAHGDWTDVVRGQEKITFDLEHGELVRSFVFPGEGRTRLLVMAHHLAGDGKAVEYFVGDILSALSGKAPVEKPMVLIPASLLSDKSSLPLRVRWFIAHCNRKWRQNGRVFSWPEYYDVHRKYWEKHESRFAVRQFSKDESAAIFSRAKEIGVTVNSLIVSLFLLVDGRKPEIGIPISVRAEGDRSFSNQTSGISIRHPYSAKKSFAENARRVHRVICQKTNSKLRMYVLKVMSQLSPTLVDAVLLATHDCIRDSSVTAIANTLGYQGRQSIGWGITNLGRLSIPTEHDRFRVESVIFVAPAVSYSKNTVAVSTMDGRLTLTYRLANEPGSDERDRVFHRVTEQLTGQGTSGEMK